MPGVLWGCRSNGKSCAVAPFSETLMSLGSLIHTTYYHLLDNVVEKCHKSTNPSWRQGCRFNFSSGGSNVCISLWMRRAADRPAVWQAAFSAGTPRNPRPFHLAEWHRLGPYACLRGHRWHPTSSSKGLRHGQGPWQPTARAPTPTSTGICAHAAWSLGFLRAFVPSLPCEQAKGNDATT